MNNEIKLIQVTELPEGAKLLKGRKELAFGEVTGHAHRIDVGDLFETKNGELYLSVPRLKGMADDSASDTVEDVRRAAWATLTHEEHKPVKIKPGIYRVVIKRQYTPEGWESVRD